MSANKFRYAVSSCWGTSADRAGGKSNNDPYLRRTVQQNIMVLRFFLHGHQHHVIQISRQLAWLISLVSFPSFLATAILGFSGSCLLSVQFLPVILFLTDVAGFQLTIHIRAHQAREYVVDVVMVLRRILLGLA